MFSFAVISQKKKKNPSFFLSHHFQQNVHNNEKSNVGVVETENTALKVPKMQCSYILLSYNRGSAQLVSDLQGNKHNGGNGATSTIQ